MKLASLFSNIAHAFGPFMLMTELGHIYLQLNLIQCLKNRTSQFDRLDPGPVLAPIQTT